MSNDLVQQLAMSERDNRARARTNDPSTSHAAAASVKNLTENQRAVKTVLRLIGYPVTDETLVQEYSTRYKALQLPRQSESGIRSRRSELSRRGDLVEGEKRKMSTGRQGRTWSVKEER